MSNDDEQDQDLRNLLQKYIERSEELEKRESQVMKQIETMQSAVTSLQNWNRARKSSPDNPNPNPNPNSERLNLDEIEEETKKIREETQRIQKEVEEKIEENRILQAEVERRRSLRAEASASPSPSASPNKQSQATKAAPSRGTTQEDSFIDMGIGFFQQKLQRLKGVEKKVKNESELQKQKNRETKKNMEDKLEILELESKIDKQIIDSLHEKKKDKK